MGKRVRCSLQLGQPFRFPFSVFRFPFSVFRFPFSVFRFPFSVAWVCLCWPLSLLTKASAADSKVGKVIIVLQSRFFIEWLSRPLNDDILRCNTAVIVVLLRSMWCNAFVVLRQETAYSNGAPWIVMSLQKLMARVY
ncbi:hypothetical protein SAMN05660380_00191 [Xylella fastidiosa]|jgi:hypothetical protein|nr:hypothetical protein XfCFBP7970_00160 [Xylella fastidiosa subsp. fastidiosa]SHG23246.1 hypothetical protein SAMN05660380_00191 [Xylella fastidiosa]